MTLRLALVLLFAFCLLGAGWEQGMPDDCWRREALRHAIVGVSVKRVGDGREVYARNAALSMRPASVAKLIPAALALRAKGEAYAYVTSVSLTGAICEGVVRGDLLVRASGDPALDSRYFPSSVFLQKIVDTLLSLGVRRIEGRIRVEEEGGEALIPGSWLWEDVANYYGAVCHGFNYRDNLFTLTFRSGEVGDSARLVAVEPPLPGVRIVSHVTASSGDADDVFGGCSDFRAD